MKLARCLPLLSVIGSFVMGGEFTRIVVEAEEFEGKGSFDRGEWAVGKWGENFFPMTFGANWTSRLHFLTADETARPHRVTKKVYIPRTAKYKLWVKYEAPPFYNVPFGLAVQQGGKVVCNFIYGLLKNTRLWYFRAGLRRQLYWSWGIDHDCWEGPDKEALLKQGEALLTLYKVPYHEPACRRNVDVILITDNLSNQPENTFMPFLDKLVRPDELLVRIKNIGSSPAIYRINLNAHRYSYFYGRISRLSGGRSSVTKSGLVKRIKPEDYIPPAQYSPWIDIGLFMDTCNENTFFATEVKKTKNKNISVELEFATGKERKLLKKITYRDSTTDTVAISLPPDIVFNPSARDEILTAEEIYSSLLKKARSFRDKGKRPKRFLFYGNLGALRHGSERLKRTIYELHFELGYNTLSTGDPAELAELWKKKGLKPPRSFVFYHARNWDETRFKKLHDDYTKKGILDLLKTISFGDEIGLPRLGGKDYDARFRRYLKSRGYTPAQLKPGAKNWDEIEPLGSDLADTLPELWWESHNFRYLEGIASIKKQTEIVEKLFPAGVLTGANYSPHPMYWFNIPQWIWLFRQRAMSLPWSEDYIFAGVAETSHQITSFLVEYLRTGARKHDLPILMYIMPHSPGNIPRDFRLSTYCAIAHGAKMINHFWSGPKLFFTENYIDRHYTEMYRAVHDTMYEIGSVEDFIIDGRIPPAEVAMYLSHASDLWEKKQGSPWSTDPRVSASNVYNEERKALFLALRHAGIPTDFLIAEDILGGELQKYKVLYLVGEQIPAGVAEKIAEWVKAGGILFATAGSGLRNEFNRPLPTLREALGIKNSKLIRTVNVVRAKIELPRLPVLDEITWGERFTFPVVAFEQGIQPEKGVRILGTTRYAHPAVIENSFGKGRAIAVGALVGLSYLRKAIPVQPMGRGGDENNFSHFIPTDFDRSAHKLICYPLEVANVKPPLEVSDGLVEWNILRSRHGIAVVLANFSTKRFRHFTLTLHPDRLDPPATGLTNVSSVKSGKLKPTVLADGSIRLNFPLHLTDIITFTQ